MKRHKYFNIVAVSAVFFACVLFYLLNRGIFFNGGPAVVFSSGTFAGGETLSGLLSSEGIGRLEAGSVVSALNARFNTKGIRQGSEYEIYKSSYGTVFEFDYYSSPTEYFSVKISSPGSFSCRKIILPAEKTTTRADAVIESTLYGSLSEKGVSGETIMALSDIFAWQIDFFNDPRAGDRCRLVYEKYKYKNGNVQDGEIIAAVYDGSYIGSHTAVYFKSSDGKISGYFTPDGGSLRKMFLKAPLNYRRISSYFSYKRYHPILRCFRPHLGIDYAAPTGTPVDTIGDGTVTFAGWKGGNGRFVKIKHNSTYTSSYGHLSRINVRAGQRVRQGDLIGRVGATGLATGPHLDFRINQNGVPINFMKLQFTSAESVPSKYRREFDSVKSRALAMLNGS